MAATSTAEQRAGSQKRVDLFSVRGAARPIAKTYLYNVRTLKNRCPALTSQPLLALQSLSFERDDRMLFCGLNAAVAAGQMLQVAGPNGSGKTTLLRLINRTLRPVSGELLWRGAAVATCALEYAASLLYIGHQAGIKSTLTPAENLHWLSRLQQFHSGVSIPRALARVGLQGYEDVPCHSLSAGQQRRVALARLHLSAAPLWVLDEPFTAIDKTGVAELETVLEKHSRRGGAVILSSHRQPGIDPAQTVQLGAGAGGSS